MLFQNNKISEKCCLETTLLWFGQILFLLFKRRFLGQNMLKSILNVFHHLLIVANVNVIVETNQFVRLVVYRSHRLFGLYQERKHFGVVVRVVGLEISLANLPRAKQFGR